MRNILCAGLLLLAACHSPTTEKPLPASRPEPPAMPKRSIAPPAIPPAGEHIRIDDAGAHFTLFLPATFQPSETPEVLLTVHFHTAEWFVIDEHLRRGLDGPLVCVNLGQGSSVYRKPFEDRERFGRWLGLVEDALNQRRTAASQPNFLSPTCRARARAQRVGWRRGPGRGGSLFASPARSSHPPRVTAVDISSFSAGYGAVRELVKSPEYVGLIRRIVLCDSMYAGFEPGREAARVVAKEHLEPWLPFARAAARGEKTFVFTHSEVPTETYASSAECAAALIQAVGAPVETAAPGSIPAADDPEFPLRYRSDVGRFHVWGYGGSDAQAHMTHARHLADIWIALDAGQ